MFFRSLFCAVLLIIAFFPSVAWSYCGDGPAAFAGINVGPFDDGGNFTVSVGYQNTSELSWWWNNGGQNNALLYEGYRPNPYEIRLNAACLVGSANLRIYLRNCLHGLTPDDVEITIPVAPPEPVMQFTNLKVETSSSGTRLVKFDYVARYPGLARMRVFHAAPGGPPVHKATWPDALGNGLPPSPVTLEFFGPGTVILEGQVCSKVETIPIRLDAPCPTCPKLDSVGDPISLEGGNMTFTDTDPLPGTGFFSLRRRYDSTASPIDNQYLFGRQFKSPLDSELNHWTTADDQLVVVSDEADLQHTFRRTPSGYTNLHHEEKATLIAAAGGTWVMRDERIEREYDSTGRIAAYRDRSSGRTIRITYDASGFPSRVDDSWGNWAWLVSVDPASGLVQSVSVEGAPTSVSYTYTPAEQLTTVTTTAGVFRTYEYQPVWNGGVGLVSAVKNGAGELLESHSYGTHQVALTSVGPSGDIDAIEYNLAGREAGERLVRITWKSGRVESRYLRAVNGRWRTVETLNGCSTCAGGVVVAYDGAGRITREQDAAGYVKESGYDAQGRLTLLRTALTPAGCDPTTASDRCRQSPSALPVVSLQITDATSVSRFEYGDSNWPERATVIGTTSVIDPAFEKQERLTFDPATGLVLTSSTSGLAATGVQETRVSTNVLYNGIEGAAFAPGGTFDSAWLTLPQPALVARTDGRRTDVADVSTFVYYPIHASVPGVLRGRLAAQRNAAGHITRFESYDVFGNALRIVDPNSVANESAFDSLGRPTATTIKGVAGCDATADPLCATDLTTTRTYAGAAGLASEQRAGAITVYEYDGRTRLQAIARGPSADDLRERIQYTYDAATGNRATERIFAREAATWVEKRVESSAYDADGRLIRQTHADNTSLVYAYDPAGQLASVQDENHTAPNTTYRYDGAGRLQTVTQMLASMPSGVVTRYTYDGHGNLASVTDPNGNTTSYTYNDFGEMIRQVSPVTGTSTYLYDAAGNLVTTTDANGAATSRTYDLINRPLTSSSARPGVSTENTSWAYDDGIFSLGRLSGMTDATGSTSYTYERRGLLRAEAKTIEGATYTTMYQYDAGGNRSVIGYPSGSVLNYAYDYSGRPVAATRDNATIVTSARYLPFGPLQEITYGNGTVRNVAYDQRYRITANVLSTATGTIASYGYTHDNSGNITSITDTVDAGFNRSFTYDDLHRLTAATTGVSLWGSGSYAYDPMGNLLHSTRGTNSRTFAYDGTKPQLASVTTSGVPAAVTYDLAGNETQVGTELFTYGSRNHLIAANGVTYSYDARGVRTSTITPAVESAVTLSGLTLAANTTNSETPVTGTVTLTAAAPAGGLVVDLTTSNPSSATVPATVVVAEGNTSSTFAVTTHRTGATAAAQITAVHQTMASQATLTVVRDPRLVALNIPSMRTGAGTSSGTVTIDTPALSEGAVVTLASSHPGVAVPSTVTVAAGAMTATFTLTVDELEEDISTTVTASLFSTYTATMAVYLPGVEVSSVTVSPRSVVGGIMTGQGTLTLSAPARAGGTTATLASSNSAAAAVAPALEVPEGMTAANFSISTSPTSGPTPVTITATYGTTRSAEMTVSPCATWVADADGFSSSETVWLDDRDPSYQYFDTWLWDPNQKVSGTESSTVVPGTGHRQWRFNMSNVYLGTAHLLTQYVLIDPCNPPRGFMVRWREVDSYWAWTHGAYWGEKPFDCGVESPACRNMGPVPAAGKWKRLEVPARKVGLNNTPVWGMAFNVLDGRLWLDRSGVDACVMPNAPPPAVPSTDVVWVEDAVPAGATAYGTWNWDVEKKASGTQSHTEPARDGFYQHFFEGATPGLTIGTGEKLFAYVLINPCNPPREIMLQFNDGAWSTRAYWGENLLGYGVDGTPSRLRMGDLPKAGEWVRLEVPASALGLEGRTLHGVAFVMYDGQAWFDRFGKAPAQSGAGTGMPAGTTMLASTEVELQAAPARSASRSEADPVPPVSLSIEARFIGETNSTLTMRRHSLYSPELQLLAETNTSALTPWITHEYVWFNGEPVAQVNVPSGEIAYYFNDHLGAPMLQTSSTGAIVWRVEREPYAERYAVRAGADRHQPLGLPGQEYDTASPDLQYNVFRWMRNSWGRYTQFDPWGPGGSGVFLQQDPDGGVFVPPDARAWNVRDNPYGYAAANPIGNIDRYGLQSSAANVCCDGSGGFTVCWNQNISDPTLRNCVEQHELDHVDFLTRNPGRCANQCYDASGQPRPRGYNQFTMTRQDYHDMECRGYGVEVRCLRRNMANARNRGDVLRRINQLINAGRRNFNCNTRGWR